MLRLPPDIEKRLDTLAKKTGCTRSFFVREAILRHIEDIEDFHLATRRLKRDGRRKSLRVWEDGLGEWSTPEDAKAYDDLWRFDVAVVLFPFIDRAQAKPRPALVLSSRTFNAAHGATVMAMITTASYTRWPSDVAISDIARAGLSASSVVRFKLFILENAIVARRIGRLSRGDMAKVRAGLGR